MNNKQSLLTCMEMMRICIKEDDLESFKNYFEQFHEIAMTEINTVEW